MEGRCGERGLWMALRWMVPQLWPLSLTGHLSLSSPGRMVLLQPVPVVGLGTCTIICHRMAGLEGTLQGHRVQRPCNEHEHLPLDLVVHSSIQPDGMFPTMRHPPPLWATCSYISPPFSCKINSEGVLGVPAAQKSFPGLVSGEVTMWPPCTPCLLCAQYTLYRWE